MTAMCLKALLKKVIVGGLDENGNVDPAQLTFVYKTGLKNSVDGAKFKPQRKNARGRHRTDELCSHDSNEVDKMCSDSSNDTASNRESPTTEMLTFFKRSSYSISRFRLSITSLNTGRILINSV